MGKLFCLDPSPLLQEEQGGHIPLAPPSASNIPSGTHVNPAALKDVFKVFILKKITFKFCAVLTSLTEVRGQRIMLILLMLVKDALGRIAI